MSQGANQFSSEKSQRGLCPLSAFSGGGLTSRGRPAHRCQGLLPRIGDEYLQDHPIHAIKAPTPLGRLSAVLPKACAPRVDVPLHGVDDIWTQACARVEHRQRLRGDLALYWNQKNAFASRILRYDRGVAAFLLFLALY